MADALPTAAINDSVTSIDTLAMHIYPVDSRVEFTLRYTWSSGNVTYFSGTVPQADFVVCLASFCQAAPKRKFLTFLQANGYVSNLTIQ